MSSLASGYLKPKEAYEYLYSLPKIDSVVVGVSNKNHATETFGEIRNQSKLRAERLNGTKREEAKAGKEVA